MGETKKNVKTIPDSAPAAQKSPRTPDPSLVAGRADVLTCESGSKLQWRLLKRLQAMPPYFQKP